MDLSVPPEKELEILKEVRDLIKDNILPRLSQLENEIFVLREVTWPVCQSLSEISQLDQIEKKQKFMRMGVRGVEEMVNLLNKKSRYAGKKVQYSGSNFIPEEYSHINNPTPFR